MFAVKIGTEGGGSYVDTEELKSWLSERQMIDKQ